MIDWIKRATAGHLLRLTRRPEQNRQRLYGGRTGLRILTLHAMEGREVEHFKSIVDWCGTRFDMARPEDVDALVEGRLRPGKRDRLLFTFDDGHAQDYPVAEWLAEQGIRGIFFVIPSYVGRTVREFLAFHESNGVQAYDIALGADRDATRGLSVTEIQEMQEMGHRIAAHNFAHRDLGRLHAEEEVEYEIGRALERVGELTGAPCEDFAWAFGNAKHVSDEAVDYLKRRCKRVYAAFRGLNVPGLTPAFLLRDTLHTFGPLVQSKLFAEGGVDDRWVADRQEIERRAGHLAGPTRS
jgi:peptidoglycan/xylan/chitin deacetylase (PgdA/CDA1 family)